MVFLESLGHAFLVVHQREDCCVGIDRQDVFDDTFGSAVLDQPVMDDRNLHFKSSFRCLRSFWISGTCEFAHTSNVPSLSMMVHSSMPMRITCFVGSSAHQ